MDEEKLGEILEKTFEKLGFGEFAKSMSKANKTLTDAQKKAKEQTELVKRTKEAFDKLNGQLDKGRKKYIDLGDDLKKLNEAIDDVTNVKKREVLEAQRDLLAKRFLGDTSNKAVNDFNKMLGQTLVKGVANATKNLVSGLQGGGSGVALAADLMSTAIDTTQGIFTGVAKTGETLGTAMMAAGGKSAKMGGKLAIASTALDYFSSAVSAAAKEGVKLLAAEAEKTIKAFNTATSAGALFGRGMDDMRMYATRAGLTVEQFSNVIKTNSGDLARAGYTVADGAKIVGNVTSRFAVQTGKSGQTLQREMLNLGLGFEEQADLTAQVVSDLKRTGGTATNGQVAQATADIAKNMRAVADIMGEEYKARQDSAKKQAEQYAFQAKVNEIARRTGDSGLPQRVIQAMSIMSESNKRAFIQATVLNGAVTDVTANLTGAADAGRDAASALLSGRTSIEELTRGTAILNDKFQSGTNPMLDAISKSTIAIGANAEISESVNQQQQDSFKANSRNITKALADAETLAGAQGGLQGELMGVEIQAQSLKMSIQDILTPSIIKFGKVANEVLSSVQKAVNGYTGKGPGFMESFGNDLLKGLGGAALIAGSGALAVGTGGLATPLAVGMGAIGTGLLVDAGIGQASQALGFSEGGVSTGPESGYQTTLHGTEAVVPLSNNRSIPVSMDTGALTSAVNQQSGILTEILRVMRDNNTLTSGILQHSM